MMIIYANTNTIRLGMIYDTKVRFGGRLFKPSTNYYNMWVR